MSCPNRLLGLALAALAAAACLSESTPPAAPPKPSPPGHVSIESFAPQGRVARNTPVFTVRLSADVARAEQLNRPLPPDSAPFQLSPDVPGLWRWTDARTLTFTPAQTLGVGTQYKLEAQPSLVPAPMKLDGARAFAFETEPFSVQKVEAFISAEEKVAIQANVVFSHPVSPRDLQKLVRFEAADGKPIEATLQTAQTGEVLAYKLQGLPLSVKEESLKVRVKAGATAFDGGPALQQDALFPLVAAPPQKLVLDSIQPQQSGDSWMVTVQFNTEVAHETASSFLSVTPEGTNQKPLKVRIDSTYHGFNLIGDFKPGQTYVVRVRQGLRGMAGGRLEEDLERAVAIRDLPPMVGIKGKGLYLPRKGSMNLGIESLNAGKLRVTVEKVYANNIAQVLSRIRATASSSFYEDESDYYDYYSYYDSLDLQRLGRQVAEFEVTPPTQKNVRGTTPVSLEPYMGESRRGLYRVSVQESEHYLSSRKWVLASDLGLSVKRAGDEVRVQVLSLETLQPVGGVKITVVSRNNQPLVDGRTQADGTVALTLPPEARTDLPPAMITAETGEDYAFLSFEHSRVSYADFDTGGDDPPVAQFEAFLFTERGVYRPGDTVHLVSAVRDRALKAPPAIPVTLQVTSPTGRVVAVQRADSGNAGVSEFTLPFPMDSATGVYTARLTTAGDQDLGRHTFQIEDFMPDRIKVDVKAEKERFVRGDALSFDVKSAYLFGPPAAGMAVSAECRTTLQAFAPKTYGTFDFEDDNVVGGMWEGWRTQRSQEARTPHSEDLGDSALDENGLISYTCTEPEAERMTGPVRVQLLASVSEPGGGRAVVGAGEATLHPFGFYPGLRRSSDVLAPKEDVGLQAIVLDTEGNPKTGVPLTVTFERVTWTTIYKLVNGRYGYQSERKVEPMGEVKLTSAAKPIAVPFAPPVVGMYRARVQAEGGGTSAIQFDVWGNSGASSWSMERADRIDLTLDKPSYKPGDTAKVLVRSPYAGKLFLSIERDRVFASRILDASTTASVDFTVGADWAPNVFVVATLVRSTGGIDKVAPLRAAGAVPLLVEASAHKLSLEVKAAEELRPGNNLEVGLTVKGAKGPARVVITAVDEGILRITGHRTPDPFGFFLRRRRLSVDSFDLYAQVLPDVPSIANASASGGDEIRRRNLSPMSVKRVKPVALWSGVLTTDAQGQAKVSLPVPREFNGSLRIMAVALEGDRFGSEARNVIVRDPIVLLATVPRFLAPGDTVTVPVQVTNGMQKAATVQVTGELSGLGAFDGGAKQSVLLQKGEQKVLHFRVKTTAQAGAMKLVFRGSAGDAETISETELPVRPAMPLVSESGAGSATKDKAYEVRVPGEWLKGSAKTRLTVSGLPQAQFAGGLQYLVQYPYGCLEQTTSRAFPLVYLKDLAKGADPTLTSDTSIDYYVDQGVARIRAMALPSGGFSYWPGGSYGYGWLSAYATHFLVEAKRAGHSVDAGLLDPALAHMARVAHGEKSFGDSYRSVLGVSEQAYALYILALAGRADRSTMLYLRDTLPKDATEETRMLLAGAFALSGDRRAAGELIPRKLTPAAGAREMGGSFWTSTRSDSIALMVLADAEPSHPSVPVLVTALAKSAAGGRWYTTQDNAYALVALGKLYATQRAQPLTGRVLVGGKQVGTLTTEAKTFTDDGLLGAPLRIEVDGPGTAYVSWVVDGVPTKPVADKEEGLTVKREFRDRRGAQVDLKAVPLGGVVIETITLTSKTARVSNVALADLIAAGFEIENPRLAKQADLSWVPDDAPADYADIRDDRLVLFADLDGSGQKYQRQFTVALRAVSEGTFALPPIAAEAMYDPSFSARGGSGSVTIVHASAVAGR